ncbi:unnamed protein product [Closterium sp. Yama58-4]|nr:unnamed protein product [Closterium sp. Yama58-4]
MRDNCGTTFGRGLPQDSGLCPNSEPSCQAQQVIRLGFLLPYPDGDSAVPQRLADEWISAVRVALEVLGPQYENNFVVEPFVQNSACDAEVAAQAAQRLVYTNVVGVVGPACSEAVKGANPVLKAAGIPFVSFAATADGFSSDVEYPTFFRTVFPDADQATAIKSVIEHFNFDQIHLFYSDEIYGTSLAKSIKNIMGGQRVLKPIKIPYPVDPTALDQYFANMKPSNASVCVFATLPNVAEALWETAFRLGQTKFPYWYLGADGAVAFDLVGEGKDLSNLTHALQGEIGVGPYKGNYHPRTSPFNQFKDFWATKTHEEYPGLLTLDASPRFTEARAYVTNLIDSIWAFFVAFNNIVVNQGKEVTAPLLLDCFRGIPTQCIAFNGASGTVAFNSTTGERQTEASAPQYGFYNLIDVTWKEKSKWVLGSYDINPNLYYIERPGPLPPTWKVDLMKQMAAQPAVIPAGINKPQAISDTFDDLPGAKEKDYNTTTTKAPAPSGGGGGPSTGAIVALVLVIIVAIGVLGYGGCNSSSGSRVPPSCAPGSARFSPAGRCAASPRSAVPWSPTSSPCSAPPTLSRAVRSPAASAFPCSPAKPADPFGLASPQSTPSETPRDMVAPSPRARGSGALRGSRGGGAEPRGMPPPVRAHRSGESAGEAVVAKVTALRLDDVAEVYSSDEEFLDMFCERDSDIRDDFREQGVLDHTGGSHGVAVQHSSTVVTSPSATGATGATVSRSPSMSQLSQRLVIPHSHTVPLPPPSPAGPRRALRKAFSHNDEKNVRAIGGNGRRNSRLAQAKEGGATPTQAGGFHCYAVEESPRIPARSRAEGSAEVFAEGPAEGFAEASAHRGVGVNRNDGGQDLAPSHDGTWSNSDEAEAAGPVRQVVKLGFLLPYPKADHVIPVRLADEWIAASRVALEVLGPKYSDAFDVVPHIANSNCDREEAKEAAQGRGGGRDGPSVHRGKAGSSRELDYSVPTLSLHVDPSFPLQLLLRDGVVGVMGPACTVAALGAADVLVPAGVPMVFLCPSPTLSAPLHACPCPCLSLCGLSPSQLLLQDGVVGVVGPACTEAALGAADVLVPAGVPISPCTSPPLSTPPRPSPPFLPVALPVVATRRSVLSRLKTADVLMPAGAPIMSFAWISGQGGIRLLLPNCVSAGVSVGVKVGFRFGDRHQAAAMRSLLQEFVFDRVILFFTEDTYGSALGYDIEYFARNDKLTVHSIPVPVPCLNYSSLFLNLTDPSPTKPFIQADDSTVVVLAVSPNAAEGIWRAALELVSDLVSPIRFPPLPTPPTTPLSSSTSPIQAPPSRSFKPMTPQWLLIQADDSTFVVLAVSPNAAEGILRAALDSVSRERCCLESSMKFAPPSCSSKLFIQAVHPSCSSKLFIQAVHPSCSSKLFIQAVHPSCSSKLFIQAVHPSCSSKLFIQAVHPSCSSKLFIQAVHPSCSSKLFIQAVHPSCSSKLFIQAVHPSCSSKLFLQAMTPCPKPESLSDFNRPTTPPGQNLSALASALQGEMGVAPYKGDYSDSSPIWEYIMHWRTKRHDIYPGLLTLDVGPSLPRFNTTRQYVPYLFDAVHAFFEAFSSIISNQNAAPTKELVLACFKGVPRGCINFTGTTGQVSFNPATGERLKSVSPPTYSIVNLEGVTWQEKARWEERHVDRFTLDLSQISRPGPLPGAAGAGGSSGGSGGGSGGGGGGAGNGSAGGVKEADDYSAPAAFDALNQVSGFKGGEVGGEEYVRRYNGDGEWIGGGSWVGGFGLGSGLGSGFGFGGGGGGGISGDEALVLGEGKGDGSGRKGGDGGDGMVDAGLDDVDTGAGDEGHHKQFIMAALAWVSASAAATLSSSFVQTSSLKSSVKPINVRSTRAVRIVAMAQPDLKKEIQEKIAAAQETCSDPNSTAECAAAWDEVEEISAAAADQALKQKQADYEDPLEKYCNENPSEDECRIYSD